MIVSVLSSQVSGERTERKAFWDSTRNHCFSAEGFQSTYRGEKITFNSHNCVAFDNVLYCEIQIPSEVLQKFPGTDSFYSITQVSLKWWNENLFMLLVG